MFFGLKSSSRRHLGIPDGQGSPWGTFGKKEETLLCDKAKIIGMSLLQVIYRTSERLSHSSWNTGYTRPHTPMSQMHPMLFPLLACIHGGCMAVASGPVGPVLARINISISF